MPENNEPTIDNDPHPTKLVVYYCESSQFCIPYLIFRYTALDRANAGSGEGAVARPTGVGGRESRRRAYRDVFTASCRASDRTLPTRELSFAGAMARPS